LKARKATPLKDIQLLILDVDGVLTDGRLYFGNKGEALKVFHVRDGHGIKLLMASGVRVAAFSGRRSPAAAARLRELRVPTFIQGCGDKLLALNRLTRRLGIDPLNCACIVDDTPDLPLMSAVGLAAAVADAHPIVVSAAHWVARTAGGLGAVRELCDALLLARASSR
jgi:3-deoxy-D-manno-octulosonate 8-phosphate phosphatase (KDO 8-P phosphatase)